MKIKRKLRTKDYLTSNTKRAGIVIRNQTEQNFVDKVRECHQHLNTHLELNTALNIERHLAWGRDTWYAGYYCQKENLVNINFERLYGFELKDILKVLCHEMRHGLQHAKGWFGDPNSDRFRTVSYRSKGRIESDYWKGKRYDRWAYKDCPWETDARAYEQPYYDLLTKANLITKEQGQMSMPGDKHQRPDHSEYENLIRKKYNRDDTQRFVAFEDSRLVRKEKSKMIYNKYEKLFQAYGYSFNTETNNWFSKKSHTAAQAKEFNKLWSQYKKEDKHKQRKDGCVVVGVSELPKEYTRWNQKALDYYWANEDKFVNNFIPYPKYNLTFRDLTC